MSKERIRPMPTAEQKARARFKMASADPFAWAMKSVDDKFPDSREKSEQTLKEEAEVEAMVRRILAKKQMARKAAGVSAVAPRMAKTSEAAAQKTAVAERVVPQKVKTNEVVVEKTVASDSVVPESTIAEPMAAEPATKEVATEKTVAEKTTTEKAIEEAFEDEAMTDDDFDDYDDIEGMEGGFSDDGAVDGGIMDEDIMKSEILDEDLLGDELGGADTNSEPEIMDDFDDEPVEDEAKSDAPSSTRPVNMVLGKKEEESTEPSEKNEGMTDEDLRKQDIKDEIRANQMDFEAEGTTKNPLIDDDKPAPEIEKTASVNVSNMPNTPKTKAKLMGAEAKQKKMMIGIVALAVLAFGGVLFGVIAMINQGRASEELAQQMAAVVSNATSSSDTVDDEFIYIKDWGMKIKIIAGLTDVSYNVTSNDYPEVLIWGAKKDNTISYTPDFARQAKNSNPLGTVVRVARYERAAAGRLIWYDDYYNYYYQGPSGIPSVSESEMNWWVESYLLIKEMLTNADNYMAMEETNTIGQQQ